MATPISPNPWHIFAHPLAPYKYGYGNNTTPQPQTLNYNPPNKTSTHNSFGYSRNTYKIPPLAPNPPIHKQNLNALSQTPQSNIFFLGSHQFNVMLSCFKKTFENYLLNITTCTSSFTTL